MSNGQKLKSTNNSLLFSSSLFVSVPQVFSGQLSFGGINLVGSEWQVASPFKKHPNKNFFPLRDTIVNSSLFTSVEEQNKSIEKKLILKGEELIFLYQHLLITSLIILHQKQN